jgi:hypothetical protein
MTVAGVGAYIALTFWLVGSACCVADEPVFVTDAVGAGSLARRPMTATATPFDVLDPEEFALASPDLLQITVLRRSSSNSNRYDVAPVRVYYGYRTEGQPHELFVPDGMGLADGRRPVVLAFRTISGALALQHTVSSIGYSTESSMVFQLPSGSMMSYPLRSGSSLFACIALRRRDPTQCRAQRLAAYGVDSRVRFESYTRLAREDPAAAALWLLIRKRDASARFPARLCSPRTTGDCASYRRFADRLNYQPSI